MKFRKVKIMECCPECGDGYNLYYNNFEDLYYCKNCNKCFCYGDLDMFTEKETEIIDVEVKKEYV